MRGKVIACILILAFADLRGQTARVPARPQEPRPPYPYHSVEVRFRNTADSVTLAGTLTVPPGKGPFPAAVLVTGSGLQDRDEQIMGHRPFLVLADYLTRRGIAVLRYDDRGAGDSGKGKQPPTTENFTRDAEAALDFLAGLGRRADRRKGIKSAGMDTVNNASIPSQLKAIGIKKKIDVRKLGVIGHSEGGTVAFIAGSRHPHIHFIVSLAGCGVSGGEILLSQQQILARAMGTPQPLIEWSLRKNREFFDIIKKSAANDVDFKEKVRQMLREQFPGMGPDGLEAQVRRLTDPWLYYFVKFDPQEILRKVKVSVLALNGDKDVQVVSSLNLPAIRRGLEKAGNADYTMLELQGLNHLFQECKTGMINEYASIEQTISPRVLEIIGTWILEK